MQRAVEALCEVKLLGVAEMLVPKDQHTVLVHAGADLFEGLAVMHGAQIDRAGFTHKTGRELLEAKSHDGTSFKDG